MNRRRGELRNQQAQLFVGLDDFAEPRISRLEPDCGALEDVGVLAGQLELITRSKVNDARHASGRNEQPESFSQDKDRHGGPAT